MVQAGAEGHMPLILSSEGRIVLPAGVRAELDLIWWIECLEFWWRWVSHADVVVGWMPREEKCEWVLIVR